MVLDPKIREKFSPMLEKVFQTAMNVHESLYSSSPCLQSFDLLYAMTLCKECQACWMLEKNGVTEGKLLTVFRSMPFRSSHGTPHDPPILPTNISQLTEDILKRAESFLQTSIYHKKIQTTMVLAAIMEYEGSDAGSCLVSLLGDKYQQLKEELTKEFGVPESELKPKSEPGSESESESEKILEGIPVIDRMFQVEVVKFETVQSKARILVVASSMDEAKDKVLKLSKKVEYLPWEDDVTLPGKISIEDIKELL